MDGILELSFEGDSSEEDDEAFISEQADIFPAADDVFESGNIYLPRERIIVEITHVYWTSRFNYLRDRVRSPSMVTSNVEDASIPGSTERDATHKVPSRYEISIKHGPFEWKINRRYNDIVALHREIQVDNVKRHVRRGV